MKKLTDRIRHHNSWRRGGHSDIYDVTKIGLDLDLIADEHDKLTEQNKMLREALIKVVSADSFHYQDDAEFAEAINSAKETLEDTK